MPLLLKYIMNRITILSMFAQFFRSTHTRFVQPLPTNSSLAIRRMTPQSHHSMSSLQIRRDVDNKETDPSLETDTTIGYILNKVFNRTKLNPS